jgi:Flp pilus assembly protein TadD
MNSSPDASERPNSFMPVTDAARLVVVLGLSLAACSNNPRIPDITASTRVSIADIAAEGGDTESARSIMAAAAAADPGNADLQLRYALAQLQAGRPDDAIGTARQTVERHPQEAAIAVRAAQLELRCGDPALASATFQAALAHGATGTAALNGLGVARVQLDDLPGAEDAFRKAIAVAPGDYAARNNLALSLVLQRRADEAVPMLQSLANEPGVPDRVRHNLALAYAQQGDTHQAATVLSEIVGGSAANREAAALGAARSDAPTALASRLAPVQVLQGKTSGIPYAGKIPESAAIVKPVQTSAAPVPQNLAAAATPPVQLHAAPATPVVAAPITPLPQKVVTAQPTVPPPASTGQPASELPSPNVITPTDPPLADPGAASVPPAPAAPPPTTPSAVPAPVPPPATANITVYEPADDGTIKVRIAAVPSRSAALTLWQNLVGMEPDLFNGRTPLVREANERGHLAYHLGIGGFENVAAAEQFCRLVRLRGPNCRIGL